MDLALSLLQLTTAARFVVEHYAGMEGATRASFRAVPGNAITARRHSHRAVHSGGQAGGFGSTHGAGVKSPLGLVPGGGKDERQGSLVNASQAQDPLPDPMPTPKFRSSGLDMAFYPCCPSLDRLRPTRCSSAQAPLGRLTE